jgi:hypothetical protein
MDEEASHSLKRRFSSSASPGSTKERKKPREEDHVSSTIAEKELVIAGSFNCGILSYKGNQ